MLCSITAQNKRLTISTRIFTIQKKRKNTSFQNICATYLGLQNVDKATQHTASDAFFGAG